MSTCKITCALFCLAILAGSLKGGFAAQLELAHGGRTQYMIVRAADASVAENYAVQELANHLKQVTGATFPVTSEEEKRGGPRIIVGPGVLSCSLLGKETVDQLEAEEFIIRTAGSELLLVGGRPRGTLYAVYHFLDNIVGIRWWAPGATFVPKKPNLRVEALNLNAKPAFEYRDVFLTNAWNPDWAARNRLNGRTRENANAPVITPDAKHGGGIAYNEEYVHTFDQFIPSAKYFDSHPEWFSEIGGKRLKGYYQLCLTNPEVIDFMVQQVKAALKKNPAINIVSVSQNDANGNCQCSNCKKVDEEEGAPSGSLLRFVNAVAERIEKEYPREPSSIRHVYVDTLAYVYTRRPPKHVRPRRNVIVRLCSEGSYSQPLDSPANKAFADDLRGWAAVADHIYIWDYIANFGNYFRPHPNLWVLGFNLRFFARNHVKGVFEQGSYLTPSGEMEELRSWVLARLLWNPEQDERALIDEFVNGYYSQAARYIREYIHLIHDVSEKSHYFMSSTASDPSPYVTPEIMSRAESLFQRAEAAVTSQPEILNRVRRAHMPVQCMWLIHDNEWAEVAKKEGYVILPFDDILTAFSSQVKADGVSLFSEGRSMSSFLDALKNRANVATVRASGNYGAGLPYDVFDGDPKTSWNSGGFGPQWIQKDMERVVKVKAIHSDFTTYYNSVTYKIEGSLDGKTWHILVPEKNTTTSKGDDLFAPPVETRFVRTTILKAGSARHPDEWVGMAEQSIEVE